MICDFNAAAEPSTALSLSIPNFKLKGTQQISGTTRPIESGGAIEKTLSEMKELFDQNAYNKDSYSTLEYESQTSPLTSHSVNFATQILNPVSEPRNNNSTSGGQIPDVLRLLKSNQRTVQTSITRHRISEPAQFSDPANITSIAQPVSPKSNCMTNLERHDEEGNQKDTNDPRIPTQTSKREKEVDDSGRLGNIEPSTGNAKLDGLGSATTNIHKAYRIKVMYPFQEKASPIPRSYEHILEDQESILKRGNFWNPSSDNDVSLPAETQRAQQEFYDKKLAARAPAYSEILDHDQEVTKEHDGKDLTLDCNRDFIEQQDIQDGDVSHHGNDVSEQSQKEAGQVNNIHHEVTQSQTMHGHDGGNQSDAMGSDASDVSSPSSRVNSEPKEILKENEASDRISDRGHSIPHDTPAVENSVNMSSPSCFRVSTSEALSNSAVNSSPPTAVAQGEVMSTIKIRIPTTQSWNPASSPPDEDELDLDVPHILGDEIPSSNPSINERALTFPPSLPKIFPHNSSIQVEKTPSQKKRLHKDLSSDILIPGTYTSPRSKPDADDLQVPSPAILSLPHAPTMPLHMSQTVKEPFADQRERNNSKPQHSHDEQTRSKLNENMTQQSLPRAHSYSPLHNFNLDGANSDLPPPRRRISMDHSPPSRISPHQIHNEGRSAKRRKITDLRELGFSQDETPYRDSRELARAIRRAVLQNQPLTEDSRMIGNNNENDTRSLASPDASRLATDRTGRDLPSTVISEQIPAISQNDWPPDQPTTFLITSKDRDMADKPALNDGIQPSLEQNQIQKQSSSLFEEYCKAYPPYKGNKKQFIQALVYLEWLGTPTKQPHKSLWDDFVRCYAHEYREYILDSATKMAAIQFYQSLGISDPRFSHPDDIAKRMITPESVKAALSPESPDQDLIQNSRGKFRTPSSLQSSGPQSNKPRPFLRSSCEQISIADTNNTLVSSLSPQFGRSTPQRSSFDTGLSFVGQEKAQNPRRLERSASQSNSPKPLKRVSSKTSGEHGKLAQRRFFETPSQLLLSSNHGSSSRGHRLSTPNPPASSSSPKRPSNFSPSIQNESVKSATPVRKEVTQPIESDERPSIEYGLRERPSIPSLERSISPPPLRSRAMASSNKSGKVADWLKNQEPPKSESSTKLPSTAPTFKGKWEFGKYLAHKRRESSNRSPRLTPRTTFSLKPTSSSGSNGTHS